MHTPRTPWQVTRSVWYALFIREMLVRTMSDRMGTFWLLAEPIALTGLMVGMRGFLGSGRHIGGVEFVPWMVTGLLAFFMMRDMMMRPMGAISANKALFAYRQVKPVDPVIVRAMVEALLATVIFVVFLLGLSLLGFQGMPADPLAAIGIWFTIALFGMGLGMVVSALASLVPEVGIVLRMLSLPLMIISGAFIPINELSLEVVQYLLWNPMVHALEMLRASFFPVYHKLPQIDLGYFLYWALGLLLVGSVLHLRFAQRLKRQ